MTTRPSDPDYWYDPDTTGVAALRQIREAEEYRPAPVPEGTETTAEERARWKTAVGRAWGMSPENIGKVVRDLNRALAEVARLTAINADLLKVNLSHAEAAVRIAELEAALEVGLGLEAVSVRRAAVLAEREACAEIAYRFVDDHPCLGRTSKYISAAIRARPAP